MAIYKLMRDLWQSPQIKPILREYMIKWRKEPVVIKIEHPTRIDRARSLGYKAKKGFVIARVRVNRGGRKRKKFKGGRRSIHMRRRKVLSKSYQWVAEERANKRFNNMTVLNSYLLGKDGKHYFFEVILVDPEIVKAYNGFEWLAESKNKSRVYHGKTSAGKRSRGLLNKGKGAEKLRPSPSALFRRKEG